jgi:hypothetical protein
MRLLDTGRINELSESAKENIQFAVGFVIVTSTVGSIVAMMTVAIAANDAAAKAKGIIGKIYPWRRRRAVI